MTKDYPRAERVKRLAREVLGEAIQGLKDPRVGFATVTGVEMTPDLREAKVFVSVLGEEERLATIEAIQHAAPHLRSILGREVRLKFTPHLEIVEDLTARHGERIEALLRAVGASEAPAAKGPDEASDGGAAAETRPDGGAAAETRPDGGAAAETRPDGGAAAETRPGGGLPKVR